MCEHCHKSEECRQLAVGPARVWVCEAGKCAEAWLAEHPQTA